MVSDTGNNMDNKSTSIMPNENVNGTNEDSVKEIGKELEKHDITSSIDSKTTRDKSEEKDNDKKQILEEEISKVFNLYQKQFDVLTIAYLLHMRVDKIAKIVAILLGNKTQGIKITKAVIDKIPSIKKHFRDFPAGPYLLELEDDKTIKLTHFNTESLE